MRINRKGVAVLLTFLLLFGIIAESAVLAEEENLLADGGFEKLNEDGTALYWEPYKGWNGGFVSIDSKFVHGGSHSLKIYTSTGGKPWARYRITGLKEKHYYTLSSYVRAEIPSNVPEAVAYKIEFYGEDGKENGAFAPTEQGQFLATGGKWVPMTTNFLVPEGTASALIYCRMYCNGTVWYDDVTLTEGGAELYQKFSFYARDVFNYVDRKTGNARVTVSEFYDIEAVAKEYSVDYAITDGDTVLTEQKNVRFVSGRADFTYNLAVLPEMQTTYTLTAVVKDKTGTAVETYSEEISKYDRPTMMTTDGRCMINGELFVPVAGYHTYNYYNEVKQCGINTLMISYASLSSILETLNTLQSYGLKGIVCMYGSANASHEMELMNTKRQIVEAIKDHPALLAYAPMDEPITVGNSDGMAPTYLREFYKMVHSVDTVHPVSITEYDKNDVYWEIMRYCDVLQCDVYQVGDTRSLSEKFEKYREIREETSRAFWYVGKISKWGKGIQPTISHVREWIYRALEADVTGLNYYAFGEYDNDVPSPVPIFKEATFWEPFVAFSQHELGELLEYFIKKEHETFCRGAAGTELNVPIWIGWVKNNDVYLAVHNRSNSEASVDVPLVSDNGLVKIDGYRYEIIGGGTGSGTESGSALHVDLVPQQVQLYKLTPLGTPDYSKLSIQTAPPAKEPKTDSDFADLSGFDWAEEEIEEMYKAGIINDTTVHSYSPATPITRGDFAMFLMRALGVTGIEGENFTDVDRAKAYAPFLAAGRAQDLLHGVGDNLFLPESSISRQDVMVMCHNALTYAGRLNPEKLGDIAVFADNAAVSDYAKDAASAMVGSGLIVGAEGNLNPLGTLTRAEAAVLIHRIYHLEAYVPEETGGENAQKDETPKEVEFPAETVSAAEAAKRADAIEFLEKTGVSDPEEILADGAVTRGLMAKLLMRSLGVSDAEQQATDFADVDIFHPYSGYILYASKNGYMTGADGLFRPDAPITYAEAAKLLVCAVGKKAHAEAAGGYPAGYLAVAEQTGLLQGVTVRDGNVKGGVLARLIQNTLSAPLTVSEGYGGTQADTFVTLENANMLSEYLDIQKFDGKVMATYFIRLSEDVLPTKEQVAVGTKLLQIGQSAADTFIGQSVHAYAKMEEDTGTILYIKPAAGTDALRIEGEKLLPKTTCTVLYYEDTNGRENSESIGSATVVFNGSLMPNATARELLPESGEVMVVRNGNAADFVFVWDAETKIVKRVDTDKERIYFKDNTTLSLGELGIRAEILDVNNKTLALGDVHESDVLSIMTDKDVTRLQIFRSDKKVKGKVTEISDTDVRIADEQYPYIPKAAPDLTLGKEGTFLLDWQNKIVGIDEKTVQRTYAYLISGEVKSGLTPTVQLKLFTADEEIEVCSLAKRVRVNDVSMNAEDVENVPLIFGANGVTAQLIAIKRSENGEITDIETAKTDFATETDHDNAFSFDGYMASSTYIGYELKGFDSLYRLGADSIVFVVPSAQYADKEEYYRITNYNGFTHYSTQKNLYFYDKSKDGIVGALVMVSESGKEIVGDIPSGVITGFGKALDDDGNAVNTINMISEDGMETSLIVPDGFRVQLGTNVITDETEDSIPYTALEIGDVIQYDKDISGMASNIKVRFRVHHATEVVKSAQGWHYSDFTHGYVRVRDVFDDGFNTQSVYCEYNGKMAELNFLFGKGAIVLYDSERDKFSVVQASELREGDYCYYERRLPYGKLTVIYR